MRGCVHRTPTARQVANNGEHTIYQVSIIRVVVVVVPIAVIIVVLALTHMTSSKSNPWSQKVLKPL